jgi:hypothetical protein
MAAYTTIKGLFDSDTLRDRVQVAMATCARDIVNEATNYPNHPARISWARMVLQSNGAYTTMFHWFVCLAHQDTAEASITDANIYSAVSAQIDKVATEI